MIMLPKGIEPTVDQTQIKRNKLVFVGCIQVTKYSSKIYTGVREMQPWTILVNANPIYSSNLPQHLHVTQLVMF